LSEIDHHIVIAAMMLLLNQLLQFVSIVL